MWRLGCKICSIHLESILEEEEAVSSASRRVLTLTAMAKEKSEQPSFITQADSEDTKNKHTHEDFEVNVSIEK